VGAGISAGIGGVVDAGLGAIGGLFGAIGGLFGGGGSASADVNVLAYISDKTVLKKIHKINFPVISGTDPLVYSLGNFKAKKFNLKSATMSNIASGSFKLNLGDVSFTSIGAYKLSISTMRVPLNLGGKFMAKMTLDMDADVSVGADGSLSMTSCNTSVKKVSNKVIGACAFKKTLGDYLQQSSLSDKQGQHMGCHLLEDVLDDLSEQFKSHLP